MGISLRFLEDHSSIVFVVHWRPMGMGWGRNGKIVNCMRMGFDCEISWEGEEYMGTGENGNAQGHSRTSPVVTGLLQRDSCRLKPIAYVRKNPASENQLQIDIDAFSFGRWRD